MSRKRKGWVPGFEPLESRQLLAASQPWVGVFTGTNSYTLDGQQLTSDETVTISQVNSKHIRIQTSVVQNYVASGQTSPSASTAFYISSTILEPHEIQSSPGQGEGLNQSIIQPNTVTPSSSSSGTEYVATLPANVGDGQFTLDGNKLSISGTLSTNVFYSTSFDFQGTRESATPSAASAQELLPLSTNDDPGQSQLFSTKSILGKYKGQLTRTPGSVSMVSKATISQNKKGHDVLDLVFTDPGSCDIEITGGIHPSHTGAFTLDLGTEATDGIVEGHITHTGRLVINVFVPGISDSVGSQKKHG